MSLKRDAPQIRQFLKQLAEQDWIKRSERRIWPQFAFHYTPIQNAINILNSGQLYSRQFLEITRQLPLSSGSGEVLDNTADWVKDCVRFYFRPKTPTQFHTEGVKSQDFLRNSPYSDAHCPVPIFFLFDLSEILSLSETRFSDKGLASYNHQIYSSADDLRRLEWKKIYHTGSLYGMPQDTNACRNAEIIVPKSLALDSLRFIYCRSHAERETFVHLLKPAILERYQNRIYSSLRVDCFERKHTFLEEVQLSAESIHFRFSPETQSPGPFTLRIEYKTLLGRPLKIFRNDNFYVHPRSGAAWFGSDTPAREYEVKLFLDEQLIYMNSYEDDIDLPF